MLFYFEVLLFLSLCSPLMKKSEFFYRNHIRNMLATYCERYNDVFRSVSSAWGKGRSFDVPDQDCTAGTVNCQTWGILMQHLFVDSWARWSWLDCRPRPPIDPHKRHLMPQSLFEGCWLAHTPTLSVIQSQHVASTISPWTSSFYGVLRARIKFQGDAAAFTNILLSPRFHIYLGEVSIGR